MPDSRRDVDKRAGQALQRLAGIGPHCPEVARSLSDRGLGWLGGPVEPAPYQPRLTAARLQLAAKVLRRQQWTCGQIAAALEVSAATVARVLRRCGLSRRGRLTPPRVAQRYEHPEVGDLLHLDSKKLGRIRGVGHRITGQRFHQFRGSGWEYLHVAVDDHSRVAYVELLPDEGHATAHRFLRGALRCFRATASACAVS